MNVILIQDERSSMRFDIFIFRFVIILIYYNKEVKTYSQ